MEHPLEKVIAAYDEAWDSHNVKAILAMHMEDTVFEKHTSGGKGEGRAAIREILKKWTATGTLAINMTRGSKTVYPSGNCAAQPRGVGEVNVNYPSSESRCVS
jgi:ketosteroid isomerase-like protein